MLKKSLCLCLLIIFVQIHTTAQSIPEDKQEPSSIWWKKQDSGTSVSFRGACAVNSTVAWASGSKGTYARTIDGGKTWHTGTIPNASSLDFRDIYAVDANTAYLISAGCPAKIFKTRDGGRTWTEQYSNSHPGVFFDAMAFWDTQNGIAVSDPIEGSFLIIVTNDSGKTWNQIPQKNIPPALTEEAGFAGSGTCLTVQGKKNVWFGTGGSAARIFHSSDRGHTWSVAKTPIICGSPSKGIFSVVFKDAKNGILVGGDYKDPDGTKNNAATTSDGGRTWTLIAEGSQPSGFRECIAYLPNTSGLALITVGPSGSDLSIDGGLNWVNIDTLGFHSISFADSKASGWAVGSNGLIAKFVGKVKFDLIEQKKNQ